MKWLSTIALAAVLPVVALVLTVPSETAGQLLFGGIAVAGALVFGRWQGRRGGIALGLLALLVSTRYLVWRTTHTLGFDNIPSALFGTGLYFAELYAWLILVLGLVQTGWTLDRPVVPVRGASEDWPTVDIYIPSYNESLDIVRYTVFAAMDLDYPAGRFRVFILDDGKREEFRAFAAEAGCGYITRDNNLHAKAGNLNAAMTKTDGDLIAIFDCDHVPTRAFLQLTVGWFQRDRWLALIQTPHHMYSPDPVQRNLGGIEGMVGEGDLFYGPVQGGNDLWNATFFCGSCAVIRRAALMETGGFAGETVTEDAHTALKLQRTGWNTAYIGARLSAGLATERLVMHVGQRIRWARGMTQILRIDCPLLGPGLRWQQRLCYLNAMLHFQFPLPRIVFLTSPLAFLIFGQSVIAAPTPLILAYAAPHLVCATMLSSRMQGGNRRPFWGEIYETILAFHLAPVTIRTLIEPRKGKFNVTDKGSLLDRTYFDWAIVRPHLICSALILGGMGFGLARHLMQGGDPAALVLNFAWAGFSLSVLLAAVSVARESRQVRSDIRIPAQLPVTAWLESGHAVVGMITDISMGGAAIALPGVHATGENALTYLTMDVGDATLVLPVDTISADPHSVRVRFGETDILTQRYLVRAVMGRADAWQPAAEPVKVGGLRSIVDIIKVDLIAVGRLVEAAFATRRAAAGVMAIAGAAALLSAPSARAAQAGSRFAVPDPVIAAISGIFAVVSHPAALGLGAIAAAALLSAPVCEAFSAQARRRLGVEEESE